MKATSVCLRLNVNITKTVDVNVYAKLTEKCQVDDFKGYDLTYGIFSKSGFTKHLRDIAKENKKLILIDECSVVK